MGSWAGLMSYSETVASEFCMKWNFVIWGKTYQLSCHVFSMRKYDTNSKQMTYSFMEPYLVVFCCKESTCNAGDPNSIPGLGGAAGEGIGYPHQYSCLENIMGREAWQATVPTVAKSRAQLK